MLYVAIQLNGAALESEDEDGSPQEIICFNVKIDA